ncbi:MAG TPA: hypothetical protein VEJ16_09110 [Alphaproteobacteria bacterium]|nr:hypothetical protein [Alphaproteobacteria bacterium]
MTGRIFLLVTVVLLAAGHASAETIRATRETCASLVEHVPGPDVTYQPGVDVNGQPVAPADMPGSPQITVPDEFSIEITANLGRRLGIPANPNNFQSKADIGVLSYKDGKAYFNGQPLEDPDAAAFADACRRIMAGQ